MTTLVRDYMEDYLPEDITGFDLSSHPCHSVYVSEENVWIEFTRPVHSIVDAGRGDLFESEPKDEREIEDGATESEKFWYSLTNESIDAITRAMKSIIEEEVVSANLEDVNYFVDIPDNGDIDELMLTVSFGEKFLEMDVEKFSEFIWDYVATLYNMDDAGTFNHPYLWSRSRIQEMEAK